MPLHHADSRIVEPIEWEGIEAGLVAASGQTESGLTGDEVSRVWKCFCRSITREVCGTWGVDVETFTPRFELFIQRVIDHLAKQKYYRGEHGFGPDVRIEDVCASIPLEVHPLVQGGHPGVNVVVHFPYVSEDGLSTNSAHAEEQFFPIDTQRFESTEYYRIREALRYFDGIIHAYKLPPEVISELRGKMIVLLHRACNESPEAIQHMEDIRTWVVTHVQNQLQQSER